MAKVELGFSGERFIYLPIPMINLMEDSPLTGDLYLYSMGYFSRASHHYINRPTGCDEFLFIYCKEGCGWIELYGKRQNLEANQFIILPRNIPEPMRPVPGRSTGFISGEAKPLFSPAVSISRRRSLLPPSHALKNGSTCLRRFSLR